MNHRGIKWLVGFLLVFAVSFYVSYRWSAPEAVEKPISQMASSEPEKKKIVFQQGYQVCIEHKLDCIQVVEAPEDIDLSREKLEDIQKRYPEPEWLVAQTGQNIYITKQQQGLCDVHRKIIHLGVNASGEFLTIYYGPVAVGADGGIQRVTDIAVSSLPFDQRQEIEAGNLEVYSEEELIGILDGLSEHQ